MKVITRGIDAVIKRLSGTENGITAKIHRLIDELAKIGVETASVRFANAQYDGTNDVSVSTEWDGDNRCVIHADGHAVAFIEFGTGVHYVDDHPKAADFGAVRGTFGYGLGRFDSWRYTGDPGTNGERITEGRHAGQIRTHGNPPAYAMYEAGQEIRNKIDDTVREVFG